MTNWNAWHSRRRPGAGPDPLLRRARRIQGHAGRRRPGRGRVGDPRDRRPRVAVAAGTRSVAHGSAGDPDVAREHTRGPARRCGSRAASWRAGPVALGLGESHASVRDEHTIVLDTTRPRDDATLAALWAPGRFEARLVLKITAASIRRPRPPCPARGRSTIGRCDRQARRGLSGGARAHTSPAGATTPGWRPSGR
jgi:hypothetical protein